MTMKGTSTGGPIVFIRFVTAAIDEQSNVLAGLFRAVERLEDEALPDYEVNALAEAESWFNQYMASPFDYLPPAKIYERAISWFKPNAGEHLARAWELVSILERNDIPIWMVKSPKVGYIYYEDEAQVFAEPTGDMRFRLKRSRL
jgi:hypothetical protein